MDQIGIAARDGPLTPTLSPKAGRGSRKSRRSSFVISYLVIVNE